jgi:AcrR family transcriptional regulator
LNGYDKRTREKKNAVIKAAQELFAEKGISEVSITEIASRASVSRVTLFKYFGDKRTLAREAMLDWVVTLLSEYEAILTSDRPFPQKLYGILSAKLEGREKIGEQFIRSAAWEDPELQRLIKEMAGVRALPILFKLIEDGKRSGDIDSSLDDTAILTYLSVLGPVVKSPEFIKKNEAFQTSIFNLFMGGLLKDWYAIVEEEEKRKTRS